MIRNNVLDIGKNFIVNRATCTSVSEDPTNIKPGVK
jgi:hypothetical protein